MGAEAHMEADNDEKTVNVPIPPEMEPPEYPTSNLHLLILGTAFFALWAGSVSWVAYPINEMADFIQSSSVLQTATVLPVIQKEFGISTSEVQWVAASSTIVWVSYLSMSSREIKLIADDEQGSSQIVAGRCCDFYGRKRMYHYGMILLILSNTLSTFMPVRLSPYHHIVQ